MRTFWTAPLLYSVSTSYSTVASLNGWPTFVRICARIRSLLTVGGPLYSTSISRMMGRGGGACGACDHANGVPSSAQMNATQVADSGGRIHPEKCLIG